MAAVSQASVPDLVQQLSSSDLKVQTQAQLDLLTVCSNAGRPGAEDLERVILVPTRAVVRVDGRDGVFILDRDVARFQELGLGDERSGRRVVRGGLEGGEDIVAEPPTSLQDGDRVQIKGRE